MNNFSKKVTIYNDIPADTVNPRRFERFVIDRCFIYSQLEEKADGTINRIINKQNVVTKDVEHFKTPNDYKRLAEYEREKFFTASPNDFVVLEEVADVVATWQEFEALQKKYKSNGFLVTAVNANITGMNVDNIQLTNAKGEKK